MDHLQQDSLRREYASSSTEYLINLRENRSLDGDSRTILEAELLIRGKVEDLAQVPTQFTISGEIRRNVTGIIGGAMLTAALRDFAPLVRVVLAAVGLLLTIIFLMELSAARQNPSRPG